MNTEELEDLKALRDIQKNILKSLNFEMSFLRGQLKSLVERWDVVNKEYTFLDRKIAEASKVRVIASTYNPRPPQTMTAKMARELLEALGIPESYPKAIDEDLSLQEGDVMDAISTLEIMREEDNKQD